MSAAVWDPLAVVTDTAGRSLKLRLITTALTYAGLLEGRPTPRLNEGILRSLLERAARHGHVVQMICEALDETDPDHPVLPVVATTLEIDSDDEAITVVWLHRDRIVNAPSALTAVAGRLDWAAFGYDNTP